MGFRCGFVGLPNVGKSTLFNALTQTQNSVVTNYAFCTQTPIYGHVFVPDKRLEEVAIISRSQRVVPTSLEFVDIAGLIAGASKGEGLGNRFLAAIREMDCILHVLRCFKGRLDSEDIDPLGDMTLVETELLLADLESVERRLKSFAKRYDLSNEDKKCFDLLERTHQKLSQGESASTVSLTTEEEQKVFKNLQLLTAKPVLYVCNVDDESASTGNEWTQKILQYKDNCLIIAGDFEAELVHVSDPKEKLAFLESVGVSHSGLVRLIQSGYKLLDLCTFFTSGPKETRAWTIPQNTTAKDAAGVIHSDFKRGFIRVEIIEYQTYIELGGEAACRNAGKIGIERKEYIIQDGDIVRFRFQV